VLQILKAKEKAASPRSRLRPFHFACRPPGESRPTANLKAQSTAAAAAFSRDLRTAACAALQTAGWPPAASAFGYDRHPPTRTPAPRRAQHPAPAGQFALPPSGETAD